MSAVPGLVLGIETSCDETSVALLDGEGRALSSRRRLAGGRAPRGSAASSPRSRRAHTSRTSRRSSTGALADAGATLGDVSAVAATAGPGLVGALLVGLSEGKGLALGLGVPFVPVHHIEAHALSPFLDPAGAPAAPVPERFGALVVSGGHTHLFRFSGPRIDRLARTRDDAAGEAFDKVAKMAGLGYPGGPVVDRLARRGRAERPFPIPHFKDGSLDFSFSGLKTSVRERLAEIGRAPVVRPARPVRPLAEGERAARAAATSWRISRGRRRAARGPRREARGRGTLRHPDGLGRRGRELAPARAAPRVGARARPSTCSSRQRALTGDNAVMVAFAGLRRLRDGRLGEGLAAVARSRWPLESLT